MASHVYLRTTSGRVVVLVDEMLDRYIEWREYAAAAADTYRDWCAAPAREQALRFAAYTAALDHEEAAANGYAESIMQLERWLPAR